MPEVLKLRGLGDVYHLVKKRCPEVEPEGLLGACKAGIKAVTEAALTVFREYHAEIEDRRLVVVK